MSCRPHGRILRRSVVVFGFGLLLSVVPLPVLHFETESVGAVEDVPTVTAMTAAQADAARAATGEPVGADRVVAADVSAGEFSAIGFTFDSEPTAPVLVRVRDADGNLGRWQALETDDGEGPDAGSAEAGRSGTAPLWVGSGTGYEVSLGAGDAVGAKVVTVRDELRRVTADSTPVAGAATPPPFGIRTRDVWGARAPLSTSYASTVKLAVVHHSDSGNSYGPGDVPGILRSIQAFHMDGRGWSDIAYNFVVDKFGTVWEGRGGGIDRPVIGAHAMGFNTGSVGVMVIGDYTQATPTAAALESVSTVIGWKMAQHLADPAGTVAFTSGGSTKYPAGQLLYLPGVVGHGDVGQTSCPGSIANSLGSIRNRAQEWATWIRTTSVPVGSLDSLDGGDGTVTARGWAKDLSTATAPQVELTVGASSRTVTANRSRPDVAAVHPSYGSSTGFEATLAGVPPGKQMACVTVHDADGGPPTSLGCRRVLVDDPTGLSPTGSITSIVGLIGGFRVQASTADSDGAAPRSIVVYVDGSPVLTTTTDSHGRLDVTRAGVLGGRREVCVIVGNRGGGQDVVADCAFVDVLGWSPMGNLESVTRSGRHVALSGWAFDPESHAPISVAVLFDGRRVAVVPADRSRPDVAASKGMGSNSGWGAELWALPDGAHTVCAVALNVGGGADQNLGCRNVVVK